MAILLALLLTGADARFEPAGVRFGDVLVTGAVLEVRSGALVSGSVVEPMTEALRVEAGAGLSLILEPGVRAARVSDGLRLSTHAGGRLRMSTSHEGETLLVRRTEAGWAVGESVVTGDVRVSLQGQQDDPDAALRRMQDPAKKMRESSLRGRPLMKRRVFSSGNPFVGSEPASSQAVRQLREVSLSGS